MHEHIEPESVEESSELNACIAEAFEIVGIFNTHDTAAQAECSVAEVEPDAIVFLEGHHLDHDQDTLVSTIEQRILRYTEARLFKGKESNSYGREKALLIDEMDALLAGVGDPNASKTHPPAVLRELAVRDCAIFFADANVNVPGSYTSEHAEEIRNGLATRGMTGLGRSTQDGAVANFRRAMQDYGRYAEAQYVREDESVNVATFWLHKLLDHEAQLAPDLRQSPNGKTQVYTLWGTSHAHSLTQAYQDVGLTITPKIIDNGPVRYIPISGEAARADARRFVIAELAWDAILASGYERYQHPLDPAYRALDYTVQVDTSRPPLHTYARLLDLYKDIEATSDALIAAPDGADASVLEHRERRNAHNLRNLLGELGLDGTAYLDYPYDPLEAGK